MEYLRPVLGLAPVLCFLGALVLLDSYKLVRLRGVVAVVFAGMVMAGVAYWINGALLARIDFSVYTRYVAPVIEELATEMAGRVRFAKLNVDENPATAARFAVQSIPTLLVLKGGQEVDRIVGVQPKAEIARRLARVA